MIKTIDTANYNFKSQWNEMKTSLFLAVLLVSLALLVHVVSAQVQMGNLVVIVKPEKSFVESGQIPVLVGNVTDQAGKPVSNAQVYVSTSLGISTLSTDTDGKFRYQYPSPLGPAQYLVNVHAQKASYGTGLSSTTFFVKGVHLASAQQYNSKTMSGAKINQDPVASKILQNIEIAKRQQAAQEAKLKQIEQEKKFEEGQRQLANSQLQLDLQGWFEQLNPFTPRNAYATFVSHVNQTVQTIFWGQFNFTEQKTNQGLSAKTQVLQNGGSSEQARKAFIQNSSSTRAEIVQVNKDLNIRYGHANNVTQAKFDKYGNLPRS
ncbi:MAG: carboxypeptidase regulatory-like domain-containing protein [Thaumarchaeota archaeon]|nr:MAG: carboxypeptidase regulatory-like domain-containing protein [Nitrososphaerota archaeon]